LEDELKVRFDRIASIQAAMRERGWIAIVILNHDDYRYLFGTDRTQPRALIPFQGPPELIAFTGEEHELRAALAEGKVRVFGSVGGQIHDIVGRLREIAAAAPSSWVTDGRFKVGLQMWFATPAFLVDLFKQVNPEVEVVSSDPVMDPLRTIKEDAELALMTEAQRIAGVGMDRARELLRPGVAAHAIATEVTYAMMRAGAEGTSTPCTSTSASRPACSTAVSALPRWSAASSCSSTSRPRSTAIAQTWPARSFWVSPTTASQS